LLVDNERHSNNMLLFTDSAYSQLFLHQNRVRLQHQQYVRWICIIQRIWYQ